MFDSHILQIQGYCLWLNMAQRWSTEKASPYFLGRFSSFRSQVIDRIKIIFSDEFFSDQYHIITFFFFLVSFNKFIEIHLVKQEKWNVSIWMSHNCRVTICRNWKGCSSWLHILSTMQKKTLHFCLLSSKLIWWLVPLGLNILWN